GPEDVEDALRGQAAIRDAAVVAVSMPDGRVRLHAYLIPEQFSTRATDPRSLLAHVNSRLASHQRVATASWWPDPDFPRTSTLKVRRSLLPLPESVAAVKIESVLAADDPVGQAIGSAARITAVRDDQTLGELGLDSMGLVALGLTLEEKTGKAVGDADLRLDMTVGEVRAFLAAAPALADGAPRGDGPPHGDRTKAVGPVPLWPYTWGRALRILAFPWDLL